MSKNKRDGQFSPKIRRVWFSAPLKIVILVRDRAWAKMFGSLENFRVSREMETMSSFNCPGFDQSKILYNWSHWSTVKLNFCAEPCDQVSLSSLR